MQSQHQPTDTSHVRCLHVFTRSNATGSAARCLLELGSWGSLGLYPTGLPQPPIVTPLLLPVGGVVPVQHGTPCAGAGASQGGERGQTPSQGRLQELSGRDGCGRDGPRGRC